MADRPEEHRAPRRAALGIGSEGRADVAAASLTFRDVLELVQTSEDYESALKAVARLSLPTFGAWSIVDVVQRPGSMRRLAIIHPDPAKQEIARALPKGWPPETEDPIGAPVAMRTRELHVVRNVTDEMLVQFSRNEENLQALRTLGMGSFVVVPLLIGDDVLGAVTFVNDESRQRYSEAELAEAEDVAALIALVIHNATLHRDTRRSRDRAQRTAEEAKRQQRDMERLMEVQSRLVRGFSHDLKNPLGAALGHAELLVSGVRGDVDPDQTDSLNRITSSIRSSLDLIDDLVEYASRKLERLDIRPAPTDLRRTAREIAEEYEAQVESAGFKLRVQLDDDLPLIQTDKIRIRQIMGNLLSNAVKYAEAGEIGIRAQIRQDSPLDGGREAVALSVWDSGPGIPEKSRELVFEEFARLDPSAAQGVGLGLAISRSIARALDGDITIEGDKGEGATFILWLPLVRVREGDRERGEDAPDPNHRVGE
jgi:signal transduction histidine kinase